MSIAKQLYEQFNRIPSENEYKNEQLLNQFCSRVETLATKIEHDKGSFDISARYWFSDGSSLKLNDQMQICNPAYITKNIVYDFSREVSQYLGFTLDAYPKAGVSELI